MKRQRAPRLKYPISIFKNIKHKHLYTTPGVILKKIDIGEADALFSIFTRDFGKIRAVAQGVKKESAKLKGHLEKINLSEISFVEGKNGYRLTSAEAKNFFPCLRSNFPALKAAFYCLEFYEKLVLEGEKDLKLWDLLNKSLLLLDQNQNLSADKFQDFFNFFEKEFLNASGYGREETIQTISMREIFGDKMISRPASNNFIIKNKHVQTR